MRFDVREKTLWRMVTMKEEIGDWLNSSDSKDYFELLRIPTVGAEKEHLRDCVQCATWLKKWLKGIGAEAELMVPPQGTGNREQAMVGSPCRFLLSTPS